MSHRAIPIYSWPENRECLVQEKGRSTHIHHRGNYCKIYIFNIIKKLFILCVFIHKSLETSHWNCHPSGFPQICPSLVGVWGSKRDSIQIMSNNVNFCVRISSGIRSKKNQAIYLRPNASVHCCHPLKLLVVNDSISPKNLGCSKILYCMAMGNLYSSLGSHSWTA